MSGGPTLAISAYVHRVLHLAALGALFVPEGSAPTSTTPPSEYGAAASTGFVQFRASS